MRITSALRAVAMTSESRHNKRRPPSHEAKGTSISCEMTQKRSLSRLDGRGFFKSTESLRRTLRAASGRTGHAGPSRAQLRLEVILELHDVPADALQLADDRVPGLRWRARLVEALDRLERTVQPLHLLAHDRRGDARRSRRRGRGA